MITLKSYHVQSVLSDVLYKTLATCIPRALAMDLDILLMVYCQFTIMYVHTYIRMYIPTYVCAFI